MTDSGLAIATLPIALFFHDNLVKQRRHLEETVQAWCSDFEVSDRVVTFGYAIAQALKEHLYPHSFIAQTLAYLRVTADASAGSTPHWLTELDQVRTLLQTGANLSTVAQRWQSPSTQDSRAMSADAQTSAIALALYCFLSTPNNLRLAIIRAARIGYHSSIVCALTGALAGAYTGTAGIPVDWSLVSQTRQVSAWELPPLEIHQLSSRLLAVWSGVYNSSVPQPYPAVVAAPWVIRPY
ncbi:MAG: ADP-ribosylglycohydrolase family protein [Leptolyngbyaceae cyanobacterium RU_5_1]|nr:ADP-ribosylglycohydrolase family protein [Leptolyngbyaceae cyanobacterium RU_5_1]